MLYDFILSDNEAKIPLYRQIYFSIRKSIENGSLKKGVKLPSIRKLSSDLGVSKTTVTAAYDQLCVEGYIKNKPQSGYFVEAQFDAIPKSPDAILKKSDNSRKYYEFDFSGKSIDDRVININEWKKYVKDVLNQSYLLTSYGEAQGEKVLRNALQKYSLGTRSVNTNADNIIVGAGMQPLLYILCTILGKNKRIATEISGYIQSEMVFKSAGYEIFYYDCDENGVTTDSLDQIKPDIVFVNPNFTGSCGANMPITRRLELIKWAKNNNALIIEDDYNGELRYCTHPIPCLQNYDSENTVYLGSFSKVLLPSVRISYMVLPKPFIEKYGEIKGVANQTASKTEQIALSKYIENGKIDVHLRKARRIYLEKSNLMLEAIKNIFGNNVRVILNETSLSVLIILKEKINIREAEKKLNENSVAIMTDKSGEKTLALSFSGINQEKIADGIQKIYVSLFGKK